MRLSLLSPVTVFTAVLLPRTLRQRTSSCSGPASSAKVQAAPLSLAQVPFAEVSVAFRTTVVALVTEAMR